MVHNCDIKEINGLLRHKSRKAKAVYIFDLTCGQCHAYLLKSYPLMTDRFKDSLSYYFITTDTLGKMYGLKYLTDMGIESGHLILLKPDIGFFYQTMANWI